MDEEASILLGICPLQFPLSGQEQMRMPFHCSAGHLTMGSGEWWSVCMHSYRGTHAGYDVSEPRAAQSLPAGSCSLGGGIWACLDIYSDGGDKQWRGWGE